MYYMLLHGKGTEQLLDIWAEDQQPIYKSTDGGENWQNY